MKVTLAKGTRDFLPEEVRCRQHIFDIMRQVFEAHDFLPIETPAIENLETLTGKYGEEGDQLLFKILNNGDFLSSVDPDEMGQIRSKELLPQISKRGLRYDLTVPMARYVVMHQNELSFPFKRYQIQPVWRADRPQKGRYQEFYQCDVDIVGTDSLLCEAELVQIYDEVFARLRLPVEIHLNHRKILQGMAEMAGVGDRMDRFAIILDKLEKAGEDKVKDQFLELGITNEKINWIFDLLRSNDIDELKNSLSNSTNGLAGIRELEEIQKYLDHINLTNQIKLNWSLARGLNYYTGCIFEVICPQVNIGSIGGGGRYDDLTGIFGMKNMSGVGVSFGAARIYDVLQELQLFSELKSTQRSLIMIALDQESLQIVFQQAAMIRKSGVPVFIYPDMVKLKKSMKYAHDRGFTHVALVGETERQRNGLTIKEMDSGEQKFCTLDEVIEMLSKS